MAGFKAFSGIHTTGCVFTYSSFLFITLQSDRYTAEISPDEGHVIRGARYDAPGLARRKGQERCELWARRRIFKNRRPKCGTLSSSNCSKIQRFQNLHERTGQVEKCSLWSGLVTQNKQCSKHVFSNKTLLILQLLPPLMEIKDNKLEKEKNKSVDRPIIKFIPSG